MFVAVSPSKVVSNRLLLVCLGPGRLFPVRLPFRVLARGTQWGFCCISTMVSNCCGSLSALGCTNPRIARSNTRRCTINSNASKCTGGGCSVVKAPIWKRRTISLLTPQNNCVSSCRCMCSLSCALLCSASVLLMTIMIMLLQGDNEAAVQGSRRA